MVRNSWKQIYPKDCYRVLLGICSKTGLSFPKVVNVVVREGLIRLGKISASTSEASLLVERPLIEPKPLTSEQIREEGEIEKQNRFFSNVLKSWPTLSEKARAHHIEKANKVADKVPNAKLVLALANGEVVSQ